jgi:hypothetical protein
MSIPLSFPEADKFWSNLSPSQCQDAFKAILANINADTALKLAEADEAKIATSKMMDGSSDNDDDSDGESWRHN